MSEDLVYIVEHLETGRVDEFTKSTRLAAMLIDHDQRGQHGEYREESATLCPKCVEGKREPRAILRVYVTSGGDRLVYLPARIRSAGPVGSGAAKVPPTARNLPTLATGLDVTQCRACQQYYVVTAEHEDGWKLRVMPVEESTFGAVSETGTPTVVHAVRSNAVIERVKARRQSAS